MRKRNLKLFAITDGDGKLIKKIKVNSKNEIQQYLDKAYAKGQ